MIAPHGLYHTLASFGFGHPINAAAPLAEFCLWPSRYLQLRLTLWFLGRKAIERVEAACTQYRMESTWWPSDTSCCNNILPKAAT
jgi:hypothetical protein